MPATISTRLTHATQEALHVPTNRTYYRNLHTGALRWDEPPSGALHVWYMSQQYYAFDGSHVCRSNLQGEDVFLDARSPSGVGGVEVGGWNEGPGGDAEENLYAQAAAACCPSDDEGEDEVLVEF